MKRIAVAIVLASLVAISCVVSVAATYVGDANTSWLLNESGTVGWLYVQNGGTADATIVRLALGAEATVDGYTAIWNGKYEYVLLPAALAPGSNVGLTLAGIGGKAIGLTEVVLGSAANNWAAWSEAGSVLTITNLGSPKNAAVVNVRATGGVIPTLDGAASYVQTAAGTFGLALSPDETVRQYDFATNSAGDLIRMWLPATVGYGESIVLTFDMAPRVFTVTLGTQGNT
jgi:hypothetical protein